MEYRPGIIREKLQISLWKVDECGVVKTKDRYFTPKHKRFRSPYFSGFQIVPSIDKVTLVVFLMYYPTSLMPSYINREIGLLLGV